MTKRPDARLAPILLASIAGALVVAGLVTAGGPGKARMEKRDQTRIDALLAASSYVNCVANQADGTLPTDPSSAGPCSGQTFPAPPFEGEAVAYDVLGEKQFRLCVSLERPQAVRQNLQYGVILDPQNGCADFNYDRET